MRRPVDRTWIFDSLPPERPLTEGTSTAFPFLFVVVVAVVAVFLYVQAAFMIALGVFLGGVSMYRTATTSRRR